jgi:hypothetical protein
MRYLWTLILGSALLGVLTLYSLAKLFAPGERSEKTPSASMHEEAGKVKVAQDNVYRDRPLADRIMEAEALGMPLANMERRPTASFEPVLENWRQLEKLKTLADALCPPHSTSPRLEHKRWEDYLRENSQTLQEIDKDQRLVTAIRARIDILKNEQTRLDTVDKQSQAARPHLEAARRAFDSRNYEVAYRELAGLDASELAKELGGQIVLLRQRAEFLRDYEAAMRDGEPRKQLASIRDLMARFPRAPDAAEAAHYERALQLQKELQAKVALEELRSNPPERVFDYLKRASSVLDYGPSPQIRNESRVVVRNWVLKHLPVRSSQSWKDVSDAFTKDGHKLQRGIFVKVESTGPEYYNLYASQKDLGTANFTMRWRSWLESAPKKSVPLRSIEDYNARRNLLLDRLVTRSAWEELEKLCDKLDRELAEYEAEHGLDGREKISFESELEFVREILREWLTLENLLKP